MMEQTREVVEKGIADGLHLGAQVWVARDGEVAVDLAIGERAPGSVLEHGDRMLWMSSGKPLMAAAVGRLVDRGLLDWDVRIIEFIPEFGVNGKEEITVAHLLTHTGGLRHADRVDGPDWESVIAGIADLPLEPRWEIGRTGGYHLGGTWVLLGEVICRVDGRDIQTYYEEEIFQPLGMEASSLGCHSGWLGPVVYDSSGETPVPHPAYGTDRDLALPRPGRNLWGPGSDLGKFYLGMRKALRGESDWLSGAVAGAMVKRHRQGVPDKTFGHVADFGYGFYLNSHRYEKEGKPVSYGYGADAGPSTFGHSGAQSSTGFYDPENDLAVVWITNGMPGEKPHQERVRSMQAAIYHDCGRASG